eukprot:TRINITY_DN919_c0_g2_i1.p1 TRINITY_DN919_c0_g2~~TRINITY_DN919_c0_g2_i1.p1  ORF type:complete len:564 (-),score=72.55 TRINITY_DN919_c0_g2_i1:79-1770(-)
MKHKFIERVKERFIHATDWLKERDKSETKVHIPETKTDGFSFRKLWAFLGPGVLVSIAYIDPGNFATDIAAGSQFNYRLIWILLLASCMSLMLQILSSRLGLIAGKDLATICKDEYGHRTPLTILLWLITESAIIASDIPEIIGTAFALNMLFGLPLWAGVVITAIDTMIFLGLQYFGVRKLEIFIASLVGVVCVCFIIQLALSPINWFTSDCPPKEEWCSHFENEDSCPDNFCGKWIAGFVPRINSDGIYVAISLVGAVVMPHNLYLHSALVLSRKVDPTKKKLKEASLYNSIECILALTVSCFINIFILTVAAANFYPGPSNNYSMEFTQPNLSDTQKLLGDFLGNAAKYIFAIALLAAGQSSTLTGTYAGQFVMLGFVDIKLPLWLRNLITRSLAIVPSLVVAIVAGEKGSTALIILSSAILSFQLPFALVPLMKFTSSRVKMGDFVNSKALTVVLGAIALLVSVANVYLIYQLLFGSDGGAVNDISNKGARIFTTIVVAVVGVAYFALLGYLIYRPVTVKGLCLQEDIPNVEESIPDKKPSNQTETAEGAGETNLVEVK